MAQVEKRADNLPSTFEWEYAPAPDAGSTSTGRGALVTVQLPRSVVGVDPALLNAPK